MVIFDRDCGAVLSDHYHRHCRACDGRWLEKSRRVSMKRARHPGRRHVVEPVRPNAYGLGVGSDATGRLVVPTYTNPFLETR